MQIPEQTQKMLRLMSQVILADGHILQSEVEALIAGVRELKLSDATGAALTVSQIREWFDAYLVELNETWSTEKKDITITRLILSLADWPDKQSVVDVLTKVSLSDAEFHKEEKLLISIVKAYWQFEGLDAPGAVIES